MNFDALNDIHSAKLLDLKKRLQGLTKNSLKFNPKIAGMIIALLTEKLQRLPRQVFLNWVFDHNPPLSSSKEFPINEICAVCAWASPIKDSQNDRWLYSVGFIEDVKLLQVVFKSMETKEQTP